MYSQELCTSDQQDFPNLVDVDADTYYTEVIQAFVQDLGFSTGEFGVYDAATVEGVRLAQSQIGVEPDGQVGPRTWSAVLATWCPMNEALFVGGGSDEETEQEGSVDEPVEGGGGGQVVVPPVDPGPAPVSLLKNGTCPSGYVTNFDYCDPGPNARYAIPKTDSFCPSGFFADWNYCVLQ